MSGLFAGTSLERPVTCEQCGVPIGACACPRTKDGKLAVPSAQSPRVRKEKRGGKQVTVISGLTMREQDLKLLLKTLKARLGAGGGVTTDTNGQPVIEIQGDHADVLTDYLKSAGYQAKRSGG